MNVLGALTLLAMVANAISTEYGSVSFTPEDGFILPMEIELNKQSMLSIPSKPANYPGCFDRTINFHDFEKGLVALKEIQGKKCLVKPTAETYEESQKLLKEFKNGRTEPVHQGIEKWTIPKRPIPTDEVESTLGSKIAKFCSGHQVYRLQQKSVQKNLGVLYKDNGVSQYCWAGCGICSLVMAVH